MAQVTQHGVSGYSQIRYGLFTGKAEQIGITDIDGRVTLISADSVFTIGSAATRKTLKSAQPRTTLESV